MSIPFSVGEYIFDQDIPGTFHDPALETMMYEAAAAATALSHINCLLADKHS